MDLLVTSLPDISKILKNVSFHPLSNLQLPFVLVATVLRRAILEIVNLVSAIANSVAILICYVYLKNFKHHSILIVDGYITIFKTFAEFVSAVACLCYGCVELDFLYTVLGFVGIAMGLFLKALLLYCEHQQPGKSLRMLTHCFCGVYIMCVLACSFAFHSVALSIGILPCVTRIVTCVLPLVALSEFFRDGGSVGRYFTYLADLVAVSLLWWYCSHLSFKYFVLAPIVMGLAFSFIQYVLGEIQEVAYKETE